MFALCAGVTVWKLHKTTELVNPYILIAVSSGRNWNIVFKMN